MRNENQSIPWGKSSCRIKCCKGCVPPKRHLGCHDTCEDYKKEKELNTKVQETRRMERSVHPTLGKNDFNMLVPTKRKTRSKKAVRRPYDLIDDYNIK